MTCCTSGSSLPSIEKTLLSCALQTDDLRIESPLFVNQLIFQNF